jgi:hypothetical protein
MSLKGIDSGRPVTEAHVHHIVGHRWSFRQVGLEQPDPTGKTPMAAREAARSLRRFGGRARERLLYLCHIHHVLGHDKEQPVWQSRTSERGNGIVLWEHSWVRQYESHLVCRRAAVRASGIVDQCKAAGRLTILDADGNLVEELKIS